MGEKRVSRWYFGGIASCGAACCTHPLDLVKKSGDIVFGFLGTKTAGAQAVPERHRHVRTRLWRFALEDIARMQNDMKLPPELRRNYAHALDGLFKVWRQEGIRKLFSGATMASSRGALVTVGQLSCYDQAKQLVLGTGVMSDNILTHFLASFIAGGCATILCQPLDVMKTRLMSSKGEYSGVMHCLKETAKLGPLAFYKGLVPAGIRLIPHTVLTFLFLEQLRKNFGIVIIS
ncbi:hypothetical protein SKAU_G00117870 [Synaphobranchus kaupii]|uniref:Mitochondrial dicarboxylate carrier n=1 Tax=Synaphobranchus kaupii TaxID=118154 RepID=A0A9Q1FNG2_SYNKA|nr:hypothetical protein SKAU_G00117870 [Synaphobranchus kaupii]